jgi:hypothetical protein
VDEDVIENVHRILRKGKNALIRNEYVRECLDAEGAAIAFPQPVKPKLILLYRLLGGHIKDNQLQRLTVPEIEDLILRFGKKPIVAFDHIENLAPSAAQSYYRLFAQGGFRFIASQHKAKIKYYANEDVTRFLDTFKLANPGYREGERREVDLTPAVIFGASLIFLAYFFKALAMAESSPNSFYVAVIGVFWILFLLARTIIYMSYAHRGARGGGKY